MYKIVPEDQDVDIKDGPIIDPEPKDDDLDLDKMLTDAEAQYRVRLTTLGGKFDGEGNFLGFEAAPNANSNISDDDDTDDIDKKLSRVKSEILDALKPGQASGVISRIASDHPELVSYRKIVEGMVDKIPADQVNDQMVLSLFYYARGLGADTEITKARVDERKKSIESQRRVDAGDAIGSDSSPGGAPSTGSKPEVTSEVAEYAKAWGLDPEKVAAKMAAAKKKEAKK